MKRPPWQRETAWLGAEGVAEKIRRQTTAQMRTPVNSLDELLSRPEWKGSTVSRPEWIGSKPPKGKTGPFVEVRHPSGTVATIRVVALVALCCPRCPDSKAVLRCEQCERRCCAHRFRYSRKVIHLVDGAHAPLCTACRAAFTYLDRKAAP